ncbi:MAG: fibronectin type III domain-containing protein [Bacteroidales bacterium]|nr:fibronectin type III domain-containing protein [Bacteroidales bacterium]
MSSLKTALDSAAVWVAQENEIQIWVAQGTYYGDTLGADAAELPIAFALADGVSIFGGFAGNESSTFDLSLRDFDAHQTILDGQGVLTVVGIPSSIIEELNVSLYLPLGYAHHTVCDGFIIQNGYGIAGALLLGNMELSHCIIRNNQVYGGGLYSLGHATNPAILKHCSIASNVGEEGGGGFFLHTMVDSCVFSGNTGHIAGGIFALGSTFRHCEISNNLLTGETGNTKAGGCLAMASAFEYCKIVHNTTDNPNIGGIEFIYEPQAEEYYDVFNNSTMDNCLVADNDGIGISITNSLVNVTNSTIANNGSTDVVTDNNQGLPNFTNCIIWSEGSGQVVEGDVMGIHSAATGLLYGTGNIVLSNDNSGNEANTSYVAFVDPQNGDYHLTQYSDCIDAGTELSPTCTLDLGGDSRLFGANPDLGCFEYQGAFCRPPLNLTVSDIEGRSAFVSWQSVSDTNSFSVFDLEYKAIDDTLWNIKAGLTSTKLKLKDLSPNTAYAVRVRHTCNSTNASRYIYNYFQTVCEYDLIPEIITVAPSNSSLAGEFLPADCHYEYSYSQQIYTAAELNSSPASITAVGLQYHHNEPVSREIDLYIGHTSKEYFDNNNDWIPTSSMWMVFSGTITFQNTNDGNWVFIPLDDVFNYNGSDNLVIAIDDNTNNHIEPEIPRFYTHDASGSRSLTSSGHSDIDPYNCSGGELVSRYSHRNNLQLLAGFTCPDTGCARSKFTVSNLTETTLDLELSIGTDVPNVELKYYPLTGHDTSIVILDITDSIYHISGLNAGTAYRICVRSICDTGYTSSWFEKTIGTLCNPENIIYVSEHATGNNSGSSWANAKTNLAEALDMAAIQSAANIPPKIWVAQGTYYRDTAETADMEIPIAFALSDGVSMYGGFAGNEPATFDLSQRDFGAHPTILDGQGQQTVIGIPTEAIVELEETLVSGGTLVGYERHTVCDGFTIQNGNWIGGALLLGNMELSHSIIKNNQGGEAGGVYAIGQTTNPATLRHCNITSNISGGGGGGFLINAIVDSCIFSGNTGYMSGGPVVFGSKLRHCEISDNLLTGESDDMKASGCLAIASEIEYCKIVHNLTENLNIGGVGFYSPALLGGLEELYDIHGENSMTSCLVADNDGIGIGIVDFLVNVANSTIANNAYGDVATHSDINNSQAPVFTNCIIWSEGAETVTQGAIFGHHSAVTGGLAGTGNITLDKENIGVSDTTSPVAFADPQNGDYRLTQLSACIDAGTTSALTPFDLAGNERPFGANPDMGCFEYRGEAYCLASISLSVDEVTTTSAIVTWNLVDTAITPVGYELAYQLKDATQWTAIPNLSENQHLLEDLPACSHLSVRVRVFCDSLSEGFFSPTLDFHTPCCDEIGDPRTLVIGNTESSTQGGTLPTSMWYDYSFTQQLFLASELGNIALEVDTLAFQYFSGTPATRQLDIYLGHTSKESFNDGSDWISYDSLSLVFSGPVTFSDGGENLWYIIPLETVFSYNGEENLVVVVDDNSGTYQSSGDLFYTHNTNANRSLFAHRDVDDYDPLDPGTLNMTTFRNTMQFRGKQCLDRQCPPLNASVVNATDTSAQIVVEDRSSKHAVEVWYWSVGDTVMQIFTPLEDIELTGLLMSSTYTVIVRYSCGNGRYGEWDTLSFTTQMNPENIIYVSEQATGNNSGSSWANAKTDLTEALSLAKLLAADNKYPQIWVAQGTYHGDTSALSGLSIAFTMTDGISMFGGFAGNEPANYDLSQRNIEAHPTILDGQNIHAFVLGVPIELIQNTSSALAGFEHHTVCDGFTVQNGFGGGGVLLLGNMEMSHCLVKDNLGEIGGVYAIGNTANPAMLKHCRFISNAGVAGGGVVVNSAIDSCIFSGNTGVEAGGLYAFGSTVRNCEISENNLTGSSGDQEASGCVSISSTLEHCKIIRNTSENQNVGGVVFTNNSDTNIDEQFGISGNSSMSNCLVANNDGTGLVCLSDSASITSTTIANNSLLDVSVGSGLNQAPVFTNCIIWSEGKEAVTQGTVIGHHNAVTGGLAGTDNISLSADNLGDENWASHVAFVDPENGDYRLTQLSDCIDAGAALTSSDTLDLAGNPRIFGPNPDMGCYEYRGELYCIPVAKIVVSNIEGNSALITWSEIAATDSTSTYQLEYKSDDESQWNVIADLTQSNLLLKNLFPNSHYVVRISHVCDSIHQSRYTTCSFRTVCEYDYTEGIITIAPPDSSSSTEPLPSDFQYGFSYSQQIFTADELNLPATDISAIRLQYYNNDTITRNIDVYMGHTSNGYFENNSAWIPINTLSLVFSGNVTFSNTNDGNWVVIPLTDTFYYDGLQNLVIAIDDNTGNSVNNVSSGFNTHGVSGLRSLFISDSYDIDPSDYFSTDCSNTCNYTLELNDSFGDGWNGGHLTVTQSDHLEETYTIESGSYANYTVALCSKMNATFSYTTGNWAGENSFTVKDQNGTVVWSYQGGDGNASRTFTPDCGGVIVDNEVADGYSFRNNLRLTAGLSCPDSGCARTNFIITRVTDTTADLEFAFGTDITSIELKYYSIVGSDTNLITLGTTNSTYHLTGLNPSTRYQICTRSVCDASHTSSWMEKSFLTDVNADNIIYVSEQATGNNSGASWANAKTDLTEALYVASMISARGSTPRIWVAQGTYYGDTTDVTAIPIAFTMHDGIQMFGGFAGNEPADYNLSLRDFEAHPTILDGQDKQVTLCIPPEIIMEVEQTIPAGFERHTVCDGFTIQNGTIIGGALLIGNMELSHCIIRNNNGYGGVYSLGSAAKPTMVRHCRVTDNMGQGGGGLFLSTIIDSCVFSGNTGSGVGGILAVGSTVRNSEISGNTLTGTSGAQKAGGCVSVSSTLENCKIAHNTTENQNVGGVVLYHEPQYEVYYGISGNNSMSNCLVADNDGTGLACLSGAADITSSTIASNSLVDVSVSTEYQSGQVPVFTNCIIWSSGVEQSFAGPATGFNSAAVGNLSGTNNINLSADNLGNEDSVLYVAFADFENGDYRLMQNSACIDAGSALFSNSTLDLAGNPRIYGTSPDMGCYEYGGETYCLSQLSLSVREATSSSVLVSWALEDTNDTPVYYELAYKTNDTSSWIIVPHLTTTQYLLENLPKCSQASVKIRGFCDSTSASGFTPATQFLTECCNGITDLTATNVTSASADLNWTSGGSEDSWIIEYGPTGFAHGTGTTVSVNANHYTMAGLTNATAYDVYVRANCGLDDLSAWSDAVHFFTALECSSTVEYDIGTGTSSSYYSPFNNFYRNSWNETIYPESEFGGYPCYITGIRYYSNATASLATTNVKIHLSTTDKNTFSSNTDWTPQGDLTLVYDTNGITLGGETGWQTFTFDVPFFYPGTGNIVVSVAKSAVSYTSSVQYRYTATSNTCLYRQSDGSPHNEYSSTINGNLSAYRANAQFITCPILDSCPFPVISSDLDVTTHSVTAHWSSVGVETQWEVSYTLNGTTITQTVTSTSFTIGNLNAATEYAIPFSITAICSADNQSHTVNRTLTFVTNCEPITLPYSEDFTNVTMGQGGWITNARNANPVMWTVVNGTPTYTFSNEFNASSYMVSPCISIPTGQFIISYDYNALGPLPEDMIVYVASSPDPANWTIINQHQNFTHTANDNHVDYVFNNAVSGVYHIVVEAVSESGSNGMTFDNLSIAPPADVTVHTDTNVTNITDDAAICGGSVTSDDGSTVTARGVCWSVSHNPTINDSHTTDGSGTGAFTSTLTDLQPNTTYYVRAYASNILGTNYGEEVSFTTLENCTDPTSLSVNNITSHEATLNWTGNGDSYNVRYRVFTGDSVYTFDNSSFNGWTTIDADGDGYSWELGSNAVSYFSSTTVLADKGHNLSHDMMVSGSYSNVLSGALTPDNYLVSPQVALGGSITFWVAAQDANYPEEHFGVAVSTTGNTDTADFTTIQEWTLSATGVGTRSQGTWSLISVDLSEYAGQIGYVAIRHFNCTDMFVLLVDDIEISAPESETGEWQSTATNTNSITLSNLVPETIYETEIQSVCRTNESEWIIINFTTLPCPGPTILDTIVCQSEMPFIWHGQTIDEYGTYTTVFQTDDICESTTTLRVRRPSYLLNDDFNDGVIDPDKWSHTGNTVVEEDGLLKLYQDITDQEVHLRTVDMTVPPSGNVSMDRKFMLHRANNYYYGKTYFYLNGGNENNNFVSLQYYHGAYEGWYGIHLVYKLDGATNETHVRLCEATFDSWITEHVELDFSTGTLTYFLDTLVATVSIPSLPDQTVDYYNVEFCPFGWFTGHQHFMDWVDIYGDMGRVITSPVSNITNTSATCGGNVVSDECNSFTARGVCWSTSHSPTINDSHTTDGSGTGSFTSTLTNLEPNTTYYVRAYATNGVGTAYGQVDSFFTDCSLFISVTSSNDSYGTCTGSGCYSIGDTVTLSAIPNPNTLFLHWSDNDTTNPRIFIATSDTTFTAVFELNYPELHVTSISHSDFTGGEPATISWTVQNDGPAPTPNGAVWYDRVWLSLEGRVAADDNNPILLGEFPNVSALNPGEYYTQNQTFNIPLNVAGSNFFLFVITDAYDAHHIYWDSIVPVPYNPPAYIGANSHHCQGMDCGNVAGNKIVEISEINDFPYYHDNFFYELVDVSVPPLPDLKVDSVSPTFQNFFSGTEVGIDYRVKNHGNYDTRVSNWTDYIFISNSPVFDENAIPLRSISHNGLLLPDSSYLVSATVNIPLVMHGTAWFYVYTDFNDQVYEHVGRYNNVSRSDTVSIILTPPADLAPRNITVNNTISTGAAFTFSFEIHNQGAGAPNNGNWIDRCFFSTNADSLENPVLISEDRHYNGLASGDFYLISHTVELPSTMTEGTYYLFVQTDVQNDVFEFDKENNNLRRALQPITVVRPDLRVTSLNSEDTLHAGAEEGVSYIIANTTDGTIINQNVTDRVFLSPSADGANAIQIAEMPHNLWLNPHDSILKMLNASIPGDLIDGDYYLFVSTNVTHSLNELDSSNNLSSPKQVHILHFPLPDLVVTGIEMPDTLTAGDTTVMAVTLHNQGDAMVNIMNLSWQLILSVDTQELSCVVEAGNTETATLPAGASATLLKNVMIPPMITMDSVSFVLTVNNTHEVMESSYNNNSFGFARVIQPYLFDLKVTQLLLPTEPVSGDSVSISWTVTNAGAAPSDSWPMFVRDSSSYQQALDNQLPYPWYDKIYLSPDSIFDETDIEMGNYAYSHVLNADSSYHVSINCMIPLSAGGDYYVLIVSDVLNNTFDCQRANNMRGQPISVTPSDLPDLRIDTLLAPVSVVTLDSYRIQYTVSNRGGHITHNSQWTDSVYINSQPTLQGAQPLGAKIHNGQLEINGNYTDSIQVTIPNLSSGNYYLIAYTDAEDQTVEMNNDTNNLFILPIFITSCALPDLQIDTILTSSVVTTGDSYQIRFTVSNKGEYNTRSSRWVDAIYINNQPTLQDAQHLGSKIHSGLLDSNAHYTDSIQVTIPNLPAGDYYLIAHTDVTDQVMEMNGDTNLNTNNLFMLPVSVSRPLPCDLIVMPPDFPSNSTIGEDVQISCMLQNIGFNTAQGNIKEAIYLSTDSVWSSDDYMLGSLTYAINLVANEQLQRSSTLTLQGVPVGDYYVVVRTNILNALNENSYANNKAVSVMPMHVDYPPLYIGQEEHRQLNSGQAIYYKLEVGPENEHQTLSCKLTAPSPNVSDGLYISYSSAPTTSNFNWSATMPYQQEQEILIPSLEQGTYYIMVNGQTADNSAQNITLLASIINFEILSVDANSGSNTGSVTTQIIGAKFDTIMDFRLANSNGYLPAEKVFFNNSTESFVTFNLRDQQPGVYDVVAELPGGIITVKGQSFVIEEGLPAELLSNIIAPASVRYGNTFTVTIEYGNNGSTDLDIAGLLLVSPDGFPIAFTTEGLERNAMGLVFETAEPNGNPDVIRPGYFATKTIFVKATRVGNINLKLYPIRRQY